ncbi:hypothetical protein C0J52_15648 [Blattella germanica]|nr:hypothetical protein C0J52_15648 [Blattella germanica]
MQSITEAYKAARQKFVNWAINWATTDPITEQPPPDMVEVVKMLTTVGYKIRHVDQSPPEEMVQTGFPTEPDRGGCRVVVICTQSGFRTVLETVGVACRCPTKQFLNGENESIITPFNEPTALVVRDVLNSLAHLDLQAEQSADDTLPLSKTSSPIDPKKDLSLSQLSLQSKITESSSEETLHSNFCLPICTCKNKSAKKPDFVERKLEQAITAINDALRFYHKLDDGKNTNSKSLFKTPVATPKKGVRRTESKLSIDSRSDTSLRPSTPHPAKKPTTTRVEIPKLDKESTSRASISAVSTPTKRSFKKTVINKLGK